MARKKLSKTTEAELLTRSRRRCCICFGLSDDLTRKDGQIAHLDRDSTNDSLENLAFLCLAHHNQYDSRPSQAKGFTLKEVKAYRSELYRVLKRDQLDAGEANKSSHSDRTQLASTAPRWMLPAGFASLATTLLFLMVLVTAFLLGFVSNSAASSPALRYILISVVSIGMAMGAGFLGGHASIEGKLPFLNSKPVAVILGGGIASFVVVFILSDQAWDAAFPEHGFIEKVGVRAESPGLRLELQDVKQIDDLIDQPPMVSGHRVLCASARLTLVVAHARQSKTPIRVHSISAHSQPVETPPTGRCTLDPMSTRPYGIVETKSYVLTNRGGELSAKYIESVDVAVPVSPENLLRLQHRTGAVTLRATEEPAALDILLETSEELPREIWFSAVYDQNGEQSTRTSSVYLWK